MCVDDTELYIKKRLPKMKLNIDLKLVEWVNSDLGCY